MVDNRDSNQQRLERISRKQFGELLERNDWIIDPIDPDMGEDVHVRIYEDGHSTGISVYVQLKSTDKIEKFVLKSGPISYPIYI
jgi:hypothetical protein